MRELSESMMNVKYFNTPEGVVVQLTYDADIFCAQGNIGLRVMEDLARLLGCEPLSDGVHGEGSYFYLLSDSNKVMARGLVKFSDLSELK